MPRSGTASHPGRRLPDPDLAQRHPPDRPRAHPGRGDPAPSAGRDRPDPPPANRRRHRHLGRRRHDRARGRRSLDRPRRSSRSSRSGPATLWRASRTARRSRWPTRSSTGVGDVQHTAKHMQRQADGMLRHGVYGLFDHMPRRPVRRVRITPIAVQRERQRRVASAVVGMLLVLTVVGASLWYLAGTRQDLHTSISRPRPRRPSCRSRATSTWSGATAAT